MVEFEYFLYLGPPADGTADAISLVDSLEVTLHEALVAIAMTCSDFADAKYSVVGLSKGASDSVEGLCDASNGPVEATSCYKVLASITVTMWNAIWRRQRKLQNNLIGGGVSFDQFVEWLLEAMSTVQNQEEGILEVAFNGFVNLDGIAGTELSDHTDISSDPTNAFIGSADSSTDTGGGDFSYGIAAIAVGGVALALIVVFAVSRHRRSHRAILQHVKHVDELRLDTFDELDTKTRIVDDDSLFEHTENLLPNDYEVQLEDIDHDYRTCASPTCRVCLERREPIFVPTEKRDFLRHLSDLRPEKYGGRSHQVDVDDTQVL